VNSREGARWEIPRWRRSTPTGSARTSARWRPFSTRDGSARNASPRRAAGAVIDDSQAVVSTSGCVNSDATISYYLALKHVLFRCLPFPSADTGQCRAGSRSPPKPVQKRRPRTPSRQPFKSGQKTKAPLRCRGEACVKQGGALFAPPGRMAPGGHRKTNRIILVHRESCSYAICSHWRNRTPVELANSLGVNLFNTNRALTTAREQSEHSARPLPIPR
jgi:hypothetical protein